MDFVQLCEDFGVPYYTEGWKYCRHGWINVECPFCSDKTSEGPHLGFEVQNPHFHCWACGFHPINETISLILNVNYIQANEIIKQYGGETSTTKYKICAKFGTKPHKLPSNTEPLRNIHKKYLESRGFDAEKLEREWFLVGTGPVSLLKESSDKLIDYRFRIIIPYIWNGGQVSFDARDITGHAMHKYQACPKSREIIPHKDILYGRQDKWTTTGICVEGTTDVWRMGVNAFATSGIAFTTKQVHQIAKHFKRVAVMFDGPSNTSNEQKAEEQAQLLISKLRFARVDAFRIRIKDDPAKLPQSEADYIVKQILK